MPNPVIAEVFVAINGKQSNALGRVELAHPTVADTQVAGLLRDIADEIERQAANPYPEGEGLE